MLQVDDLVKTFSGRAKAWRRRRSPDHDDERVLAVDGVSFDVQDGDLFTLLGPSGCGKTSTLRAIAGLERPDNGVIRLGDRTFFSRDEGIDVPTNERDLGMVFQSYAIWPHMDVYSNVAFPLETTRRRRGLNRRDIREKVERVLEVTELSSMIDRQATKLSGGQQQRLALSRALVTEPDLMLLDEPLSNLDAKLRESMRLELLRLQQELGLTAIYVTHDQVEALSLSTFIAVMDKGRIMQIGKPRDIYEHPNSQFVAEFIGTSNFIPGTIESVDGQMTKVQTNEGDLWTVNNPGLDVGSQVTVCLRPEDVRMQTTQANQSGTNEWQGLLVAEAFLGDALDHVVRIGKYELRCRSNPGDSAERGRDVYLTVPPERVRLLPVRT